MTCFLFYQKNYTETIIKSYQYHQNLHGSTGEIALGQITFLSWRALSKSEILPL